MLELAFNLSGTFLTNYRDILDSCLFVLLIILIDVFQVQADIVSSSAE